MSKKANKPAKKGTKSATAASEEDNKPGDIIPVLLTWSSWQEFLELEDDLHYCIHLADEMVDIALKECVDRYFAKHVYPYAAGLVGEALVFLALWKFPRRDEGEGDLDQNPSWIPDREPDTVPYDIWDRGVLPKAGYMHRRSPLDDETILRLKPQSVVRDAGCSCIKLAGFRGRPEAIEEDVNSILSEKGDSPITESPRSTLVDIYSARGRSLDSDSSEDNPEDFPIFPEVTGILHPTNSSLEAIRRRKKVMLAMKKEEVKKEWSKARKGIGLNPQGITQRRLIPRGAPSARRLEELYEPEVVMTKVERLNKDTMEEYKLPSRDTAPAAPPPPKLPTSCTALMVSGKWPIDPDKIPKRRANVEYEVVPGEEVVKIPDVAVPGMKRTPAGVRVTPGSRWTPMKLAKSTATTTTRKNSQPSC